MRHRLLLRDSTLYGLAAVLQKVAPMLLIPFLAAAGGPGALKTYDLALLYALVAGSIAVLGQDIAASAHYFDPDKTPEERQHTLPAALQLQVVSGILLLLILFVAGKQLFGELLFPGDAEALRAWQTALWLVPGYIASNYGMNILRWTGRSLAYTVMAGLQSALMLGFTWALYAWMGRVAYAALWGYTLAISLAGAATLWMVRGQLKNFFSAFSPRLLRALLSYGVPFAAATFLFSLLPALDRSYLLHFRQGAALGEYILASKISAVMGMAGAAFGMAFTPLAMRAWHRPDAGAMIGRVFSAVVLAFFVMIPAAVVFRHPLVEIFADGNQFPASESLLPYFFYASAFDAFLYVGMLGIYRSKKALPILFILAGSTSVAILLYLLLIPRLGPVGAALSYAASKACQFLFSWGIGQRHLRLRVNEPLLFLALALSVLLCWSAYQLPQAIYVALVVAVAVGTLLLGRWLGLFKPLPDMHESHEAETTAMLSHDLPISEASKP